MIKVVMTLKKRPELSREEFIDYYDNKHVPFMHGLLGRGGASVHRRNFVDHETSPDTADFDVVSEVFYRDRDAFEAAVGAFTDPEVARRAREDEDRFVLPGSIQRYVVEVHETVFERVPESHD